MFAYIGLAVLLMGFLVYLFTDLLDERRILLSALLMCSGLAAIVANAAATSPADTEVEPASVQEARDACRHQVRQAEADAWFESQRK